VAEQSPEMLALRVLQAEDHERLEAFLRRHRDTSMFLRSNARQAGLVYTGKRLEAVYMGAFQAGELVGVAAHGWNGMLLMQAPEQTAVISRALVEASRRPVSGLAGPAKQVREARGALALDEVPATLEEDEDLYVLDLAAWQMPDVLKDTAECRPPFPSERDTLIDWRVGYEVETLGRQETALLRAQAADWMDGYIADGVTWVAAASGRPVSLCMFNARMPDIVQLGGVYTPPAERGRGYARAVVAHSVLEGKKRGADRAVLFTSNPNAVRSYEAVGFRRAGDFGLVLFI
jgi:ribosomal protein S18 acetylase RimI-like enzyme